MRSVDVLCDLVKFHLGGGQSQNEGGEHSSVGIADRVVLPQMSYRTRVRTLFEQALTLS